MTEYLKSTPEEQLSEDEYLRELTRKSDLEWAERRKKLLESLQGILADTDVRDQLRAGNKEIGLWSFYNEDAEMREYLVLTKDGFMYEQVSEDFEESDRDDWGKLDPAGAADMILYEGATVEKLVKNFEAEKQRIFGNNPK